MKPKILAFSGSTRKDSFNHKLLLNAVEAIRASGTEVTVFNLRDHPLPLYDGDLEANEGVPAGVKSLKALFKEHQGLLIASPEYNSSISGVLKNTIDWVSRTETGDPAQGHFQGKTVGLISASPGAFGGMRGLIIIRSLLSNMGMMVVPEQLCLPKAHEAFDEAGVLKDEKVRNNLHKMCASFVLSTNKLHS
jgi:chromate reductase